MNMEIRDFDFFVDREKNRPCLVAGLAPSLRSFKFDEFKGIYFLINQAPLMFDRKVVSLSYWLGANHCFPVPHLHLKKINAFKGHAFIFSDTAVYSDRHMYDYNFLKENITVPWFAFDDRHFYHRKCQPLRNCCKLVDLYPERPTLYEFIRKHFDIPEVCPIAGTSVLASLAFAILMGCSPIYLQGIELPLYLKDQWHYKNFHPLMLRSLFWILRANIKEWIYGVPQYADFAKDFEKTLSAFQYMVNLCHKLGIEIYNLSPTSALNRIDSLPYLDYRKVTV